MNIKVRNHCKWYPKIFEFETPYQYMAFKFWDILNNMGIAIIDFETCPDYIGSSTVKFSCTKKDRIRAEYIFRRYSKLDRRYLLNLDTYQDNRHKYENDHYMIY